jgi:hypothetical protein
MTDILYTILILPLEMAIELAYLVLGGFSIIRQ